MARLIDVSTAMVAFVCFWLIPTATAATFNWTGGAPNNYFIDADNWSPFGGPPGSGDEASFRLAGGHTVLFQGGKQVETTELYVEKGSYSLRSDSLDPAVYNVTSGASTAAVLDAFLSVGSASTPIDMTVTDDFQVDADATVQVGGMSSLALGRLRVGTQLGGVNAVTVSGAGSSLAVGSGTQLGGSGDSSSLTFNSGATGSLNKDTVLLNFSSADGTTANLDVRNGSTLVTETLLIGLVGSSSATRSARLWVDDPGSSVTQVGTTGLLVGTANNPNLTAELWVTNGGVFHSGTGNVRFRSTGELLVGESDGPTQQGVFNANGPLSFESGALLRVGGVLNAYQGLDYSDGEINFYDGDLRVEGGAFVPALETDGSYVYRGAPDSGGFGTTPTELILGAGATFMTTGPVQIGAASRFARLRAEAGAQIATGPVVIGALTLFGDSLAELEVTGSGTQWDVDGSLRADYGGFDVTDQAQLITGFALIQGESATVVDSAGWNNSGSLSLLNGASLTIDSGGSVSTGSVSAVSSDIGVSGGAGLTVASGLTLNVGSSMTVASAGPVTIGSANITAESTVDVADGSWTVTGDVDLGNNTSPNPSVLTAGDGALITIEGELDLNPTGVVKINLGTVILNGDLVDDGGEIDFIFDGRLNLNSPDVGLLVNSTDDELFAEGVRVVGAGQLSPGQDLSAAGELLVATGGRFHAAGGDVDLGGLKVAFGGEVRYSGGSLDVAGPVVAAAGSEIHVTGGSTDATLGDASLLNGVYIAGELRTGRNTVTLLDANDAVFDSGALVVLGNGLGNDGTLVAANGLTLDFGGNITGDGVVVTPDDPTKPLTNNGNIIGSDPTDPLELTGYVKGVGTLDNVVITGTDAPGFSPATVVRGSVEYAGVLEIELAGTGEGEFDRLEYLLGAGEATLGGELVVALLSGFRPASGDVFEFLTTEGGVSGLFTTETLPALGGGIGFDVQYGPDTVSLAVVGVEGDYNGNGVVDAADFTVWRDSLNQTGEGLAADGDGDGAVDQNDYAVWVANFGQSASALAEAASVPEPAALVLLACGLAALRRVGR
ncbi:hypothetical protein Mal64_28430 [Pseudobythopirellula maris]|uniref:Autotransporter-associated beta strand repeat protein n=1 Tax=Pseudobythopirellula maris TaxID=2527991 RepID=A0A5C5ZJJ4_9BACT|nr:dockerin type I domain-containing protein [Pseudobythopirellula maris]TWT87305.1 hypothetical protein Mal64_28430 [Pseudobythopirellula maris]